MTFDAAAAAAALLDTPAGGAEATLHPASDAERVAVAWSLKERGYGALYADLALAQRCADAVQRLCGEAAPAAAREMTAVSEWIVGAVDAMQGRAARAIERLQAASAAFEAIGDTASATAAQVPVIAALSMLGRHDEALACATRTLEQFAAAGDERSAGKVEINLGSMLLRLHRYAESGTHYRRAAVRFARVQDRQHSVMADIGLASALSWQFAFDEALRIYSRADSRARSHGLISLLPIIEASRGLLELHRGQHAPALKGLEAALSAYEISGPPQRLVEARIDLATAYLTLNLLPEARALLELAAADGAASAAPVEQAWAGAWLAQALARAGRLDEARSRLAESRAAFAAQGNAVGVAWLDMHGAAVALSAGQAAAALAQAEAAMALLARSGMRGWWLLSRVLQGEALLVLGRAEAASLQLLLDETEDLPELHARARTTLGALLRRGGDRRGARRQFEAAAAAIERQQAQLPGEEFRAAYGADKQDAFDALVELALDDVAEVRSVFARAPSDDSDAAGTSIETAPRSLASAAGAFAVGGAPAAALFDALERQRARALRLALADGEGGNGGAGTPQDLRVSLHWLDRQVQQALSAGDAARAAELQQQALALEAQALEAHRRIAAAAATPAATEAAAAGADSPAAPALDSLDTSGIDAALAALGRRVGGRDDGAALVAYGWVGERLAVVLRRGGEGRAIELDAAGLEAQIEQLRFQLHTLRFGSGALAKHLPQMTARVQVHLQALYRRLWAPLAPWLAGATQVVVVPHRALHYLPFCALHDGKEALLDHHALVQVPSAALWLATARPRSEAPAAVGAGAASTDSADGAIVLGMGGAHLPQVRQEVLAVAEACGEGSTVLLDGAATLPALHAALARSRGALLHLACHGQFRADSPYFSSITLADGALTLRDAAALPLAGRLVALSACETGLSRIAPGDELVGLVRAFLAAGARAVLASLWTVEDRGTAELMGDFYRGLHAGLAPAVALRAAQRERRKAQPHPYFWAPFVVHGCG